MTQCYDCGREIEGPVVETPDGDTYHYACVDVDYPEPAMPEDVVDKLLPEEFGDFQEPLREFYEDLMENPYDAANDVQGLYIETDAPVTIDLNLFGYTFSWDVYHRTKKINITPILVSVLFFGSALEREYPAYADRDELYPRDEARVPPGEETELPDDLGEPEGTRFEERDED